MSNSSEDLAPPLRARQVRLSELARADEQALVSLFASFAKARPIPETTTLRSAEFGTAMVRGRAGATGAPFNLGEMSVTRMSVRLPCDTVGHGYVQGRSKDAARMAAILDAMAEAGSAVAVDAMVVSPLRQAREEAQVARAAKAAATKVEFFTMVRGEG